MFNDANFYVNILFNVLFISIFIAIFFFTYASKVEKKIIVKQTKQIVDYFTENITILAPNNNIISDYVKNLQTPDFQKENAKVKLKNQELFHKAIISISILSFIIISINTILIYKFNINWKKMLLFNIISLICVAITEFFFLTIIASNFISFDPNFIKYIIVNKLNDFKKSN